MTTVEFSIEFDKLYDNLSTMGAPGVDAYEKSLFLTQAQEFIVKELVTGTPRISMLNQSFEIDESIRRSLDNIVIPYFTSDIYKLVRSMSSPSAKEMVTNKQLNEGQSYVVKIPTSDFDKMWFIVQEQGYIYKGTKCGYKWCDIVPKGHDEYTQIQNPFRVPDDYLIWRFNVNANLLPTTVSDMANKQGIELVSKYRVDEYKCRYIRKPNPIIVENLSPVNTDLYTFYPQPVYPAVTTLSIDGVYIVTECELNSKVHRLILNKAVDLAIAAYKENNLQSKLLINQGLT